MNLYFVILILSSCAIGSFALEKEANTCLVELNLNDTYRELLQADSFTLALNQYDEQFVKLIECIFTKAGAIKDGQIQPEILTGIINDLFEFEEDEVALAVSKCKNENGETSLDTMYKVGECLDKELE